MPLIRFIDYKDLVFETTRDLCIPRLGELVEVKGNLFNVYNITHSIGDSSQTVCIYLESIMGTRKCEKCKEDVPVVKNSYNWDRPYFRCDKCPLYSPFNNDL